MALTIYTTADEKVSDYYLHRRLIDFDNSYAAGGMALTAANLGFSDNASNLLVLVPSKGGFAFEYDGPNAKIKVLTPIKTYTATFDAASLAGVTARDDAVTVTGVAATDVCVGYQLPAAFLSGMDVQLARVSGTNTITVRHNNASAGALDAASGTYTFYVMKANGAPQEVPATTDLSALTGVVVFAYGKNPV